MRLLRALKTTLAVLAFVFMTLKIQLELQVLREGKNIGGYSPWWGNETIGHLRAFPKLATKPNATLNKLRATASDKLVNALAGNERLTRAHGQRKLDQKSSNRKILSDGTKSNTEVEGSGTEKKEPRARTGLGIVSRISHPVEHNVTAAEPLSNKIWAGIFAKLRIFDGENTIDTDDIYAPQRRETSERTHASDKASISQNNRKEPQPKLVVLKQPNSTKVSSRSPVPMPKLWKRPQQRLVPKGKSPVAKGVSHDVDKHEMSLTKEEIADIKEEITQENERQIVYNEERFGSVKRNTTILLVQVSLPFLVSPRMFSVTCSFDWMNFGRCVWPLFLHLSVSGIY